VVRRDLLHVRPVQIIVPLLPLVSNHPYDESDRTPEENNAQEACQHRYHGDEARGGRPRGHLSRGRGDGGVRSRRSGNGARSGGISACGRTTTGPLVRVARVDVVCDGR
jgi:hypothetical protein